MESENSKLFGNVKCGECEDRNVKTESGKAEMEEDGQVRTFPVFKTEVQREHVPTDEE